MTPTPNDPLDAQDRAHLDRAFALGEHGRGRVSPNPFVGCVVVAADGRVVGEGWTQPPGGPHAEAMALAAAGDLAAGATAYVTLEPCNHTGRTGPCAAALVDAGVSRVVHALADPDPVAGGGGATLREAGVEVVGDVAADRARRTHEVFLHGVAAGRPFVVWKVAMSLDGRTVDHEGRSQWISGPAVRQRTHALRAEADAVVVGSGTVLADDPQLTVRLDGWDGPQPLRVVLDRRGRLRTARPRLLTDGLARTLVLDQADPKAVLATLWDHGVRSILLEGGAGVAGAFVADGLVDRYELHLGNVLLGHGRGAVDLPVSLADAPRLRLASTHLCGDDVVVTAYPPETPPIPPTPPSED